MTAADSTVGPEPLLLEFRSAPPIRLTGATLNALSPPYCLSRSAAKAQDLNRLGSQSESAGM